MADQYCKVTDRFGSLCTSLHKGLLLTEPSQISLLKLCQSTGRFVNTLKMDLKVHLLAKWVNG
jgi:hypothetical protein